MTAFYVAHDREYQKIWRWNVPEVFWFEQGKPIKPVKLTKPWQQFIYELNQPGMTPKWWRGLMGINTAFTNTNGYGSGEIADFIGKKDTNARPPVLDKPRICGGAIFHGTLNGDIITVETLDGSKKPPTVKWLVAHPWLMFRCYTVLPDGSNADFPYRGGQPVFMPVVSCGGPITVKYKKIVPSKPYPYVRKA